MVKDPFSNLCSIQLTLIGISFSIFTILYSLIIGKIETLKYINNQIKTGNKNPLLKGNEHCCRTSIQRLKQINKGSIAICLCSIILLILMECFTSIKSPQYLIMILKSLNYLEFIGIILLIIIVFRTYFDDVTFD